MKKSKKKASVEEKKEQLPHQFFLKKHEQDIQLLLIPLILSGILCIIFLIQMMIRSHINSERLNDISLSVPIHPYPILSTLSTPQITAQAGIVMDNETKALLYAKNPDLRFSMASTTKVMTALTALDYFKPTDVLTVQMQQVEGSNAGLMLGEQMTFENLLYAMLLPSGNDAAFAIAMNYPGGLDAFVQKMNQKAQELHLYDTHFGDPAGLNDDEDYTTAHNLALLASAAIKSPIIAKVGDTKHIQIATVDGGHIFDLYNLNKLLGENGVTGLKTGTTEGAGEVLVTSKVENGHAFILVVMRSQDRFADTEKLLSLITNNVSYFHPQLSISGL